VFGCQLDRDREIRFGWLLFSPWAGVFGCQLGWDAQRVDDVLVVAAPACGMHSAGPPSCGGR
jgi:hypothetical protein